MPTLFTPLQAGDILLIASSWLPSPVHEPALHPVDVSIGLAQQNVILRASPHYS